MSEFSEFPPDVEELVRGYIAAETKLPAASDPSLTALRGRQVTFYENVWLGFIEKKDGTRYYFLTRPRGRKGRLVPISNTIGSIDRANRIYRLELTRENVADYLHFYYSFTPKEDAMLSRLSSQPTQFAVPRSVDDLVVEESAPAEKVATGREACSEECLVRGAVWHFLDEATHERIVPLRYKRRRNPSHTVSGRLPIQFRHAMFAVDFRVPQVTGVPVLSNEELLYQGEFLKEPQVFSDACLTLPKNLVRRERLTTAWKRAKQTAARLGRHASQALWWGLVGLLLYFWGFGALFCVSEAYEMDWVRGQFIWWTEALGGGDWAVTGYRWTVSAITTFLALIVMTTHRDKVFNWVFRLCPKHIQSAVARVLDYFVTRWDDALIAQNTFPKRAWWAAVHLVFWSAYLVCAFTSLQMLSDLTEGNVPRPPLLVSETLLLQAGLNLPFVTFAFIQLFQFIERLDPVAEGILDYRPLAFFQAAMGLVVFGGVYRVWVFTVEASPYTFFRRLRKRQRKASAAGP